MTDLKAKIKAQYQEALKDLNTLSDKELREKYTVMPSGWVLLDATHAAKPAPVAVEAPNGAIHNGRVFMNRLDGDYSFECDAGLLRNCSDWQELKRCFEAMAEYIERADLAPTVNAALVEAADRIEQAMIRAGWNGALTDLYSLRAALQPAASQPTPEVEALRDAMECLLALVGTPIARRKLGISPDDERVSIVRAALARGSVAEKGDQGNG